LYFSLGLIPVILIAALVAGSGCYVIRKDNAENFSGIEALTRKLKTENTKTLETVESMRKNLEQKDSVIKELQLKVSAGNEKNRMVILTLKISLFISNLLIKIFYFLHFQTVENGFYK
jgi:uncharacterized protein HemX